VPIKNQLNLHITGSNFFIPVEDELLNENPAFWDQLYSSENEAIYRGEYLWYQYANGQSFTEIPKIEQLRLAITKYASGKLNAGYEKGIHDHDAALIGLALLNKQEEVGLLTFDGMDRAWANLYWNYILTETEQRNLPPILLKPF